MKIGEISNAHGGGIVYTTEEVEIDPRPPEEVIADAVNKYGRVPVAFSGGIESRLLLELCRPHKDAVTIYTLDTGATFPHMRDYIRRTVEGFDFVEVRSNVFASFARNGYPAAVVPAANTRTGAFFNRRLKGPLIRPWQECCIENRGWPFMRSLVDAGYSVLIYGQRADDFGVPPSRDFNTDINPAIRVINPLWNLSRADVVARVDALGLELPSQYWRVGTSLDCWACPQIYPKRAAWMREEYPDLAAKIEPIWQEIDDLVKAAQPVDTTIVADQ